MALIQAWSSGGKNGLAAPSGSIRDREFARGPAASPALHLPGTQPHQAGGFDVAHVGTFGENEHESKSLGILHGDGVSSNGVLCHLQKVVGKVTGE